MMVTTERELSLCLTCVRARLHAAGDHGFQCLRL